jgi:flagellar hook-associated protein 1 FlgK
LRSVESATTDYTTPVTVTFGAAGAYTLTDSLGNTLGTGTLQPPQNTVSFNGWAFNMVGSPVAGDTFTVNPDAGDPSGDNRNGLALATLGTAKVAQGGTASLTDAYASIVAQVGTRANAINISQTAQQTASDQASAAEQSLSGVNLDEEGANLIRFQQAYAAAGKVLSMSSDLFNQLLTSLG